MALVEGGARTRAGDRRVGTVGVLTLRGPRTGRAEEGGMDRVDMEAARPTVAPQVAATGRAGTARVGTANSSRAGVGVTTRVVGEATGPREEAEGTPPGVVVDMDAIERAAGDRACFEKGGGEVRAFCVW